MFRILSGIMAGLLFAFFAMDCAMANEAMKEHLSKYASAVKSRRSGGAIQLTSPFGMRHLFGKTRLHKGVDIGAPTGTTVTPILPGIVISAGWNSGGYGNLVVIYHGSGVTTRYAHLNEIHVRPGRYVHKDTPIGRVGNTGLSTGPHLHFEIRHRGDPIDPLALARKKSFAEKVSRRGR